MSVQQPSALLTRATQSTSSARAPPGRRRLRAPGSLGGCSPRPTAGRPAPSATGTGAGRAPPGCSCTGTARTGRRCCCSTAPSGRTTAAPGARRAARCTRARPPDAGALREVRRGARPAAGRRRPRASARSTTTAAGRTRPSWPGPARSIEPSDLRLDGESNGAAWLPLDGLARGAAASRAGRVAGPAAAAAGTRRELGRRVTVGMTSLTRG